MKTIWKYELRPLAEINMPRGAQVLTVQVQNGIPQIWVFVNADYEFEEVRKFITYGTGHKVPDNPGRYIGTFQLAEEGLVFHVFEPNPPLDRISL